MSKHKWCLLTSGFGRSANCVLNLHKEGELDDNQVALVVYDRVPSGASLLAQEMGIPTVQVKKAHYEQRQGFEEAILKECRNHEIEYVFLLGFNYLLSHSLLNYYRGRIVNVHPSLLPAFRGKRAIQQAMSMGVKVTGITTHMIDEKLDEGKIICQEPVRIENSMSFAEVDNLFMQVAPTILRRTILTISRTKG